MMNAIISRETTTFKKKRIITNMPQKKKLNGIIKILNYFQRRQKKRKSGTKKRFQQMIDLYLTMSVITLNGSSLSTPIK